MKNKGERNTREKSIRGKMMRSALFPAVLMMVIIVAFSHTMMKNAIDKSIKIELMEVANMCVNIIDREIPGDYSKEGEIEVTIYKGDTELNNNYDLIDSVVSGTDVNITLFYNDLRVISTITDEYGNRLVSIAAHAKVKKDVLESGKSKFYNNVTLNGVRYYAYYKVIYNSDGSQVGMLEVLKPANKINAYIIIRLIPIYVVGILGILLIARVSYNSTGSFVSVIDRLEKQFTNVSKGKIDEPVDASIQARRDEFGSMARSVAKMQVALRAMIELDTLTQINNRRRGDAKLAATISKSKNNGTEFCVAIGDIDYFKKVNDTYGHDAGDAVLVSVASLLKKGMQGRGFVARWGGEEFLIVFDKIEYEDAKKHLNRILEKIRAEVIHVNGVDVSVTMSFGITKGRSDDENNIVIKRADELLYKAKSTGRNRVVSSL